MKSKDQVMLEEAYAKISSQKQVIEEKGLKSLAAGAALGLATLTGLHAGDKGMTADDLADRSMIAQTNSPEMQSFSNAREAYEAAIELIHSGKKLPDEIIKLIASDKDIAARCAHLMVLKKIDLPKAIRAVVGDVDREIKASLMGP